jgi:ABC-2 type transport system permease protein
LNKDANQIPIAIVDLDHSELSRTMIRFIESEQKVYIVDMPADYQGGVESLYTMKAAGFLYIPKGTEKAIRQGEQSTVKLFLNNTRFLPSNGLNAAVQAVALTIDAGIRIKYFMVEGNHPDHAMELALPLSVDLRPIYNPTNNYGDFLLPGLFLLIIQQTLLIGLGESMAEEKLEKKFFEKYSLGQMLYGKSSFYVLLYATYFVFFYTVLMPFFNLDMNGKYALIIPFSALFLFTIILYTLFVSSFFKKPQDYMEIMAFTSYPIFLVTGFSWPVNEMPVFMQWISYLNPASAFFNGTQRIIVMDAQLHHIIPEFTQLLILFALGSVAVVWRYGFLRKRSVY